MKGQMKGQINGGTSIIFKIFLGLNVCVLVT